MEMSLKDTHEADINNDGYEDVMPSVSRTAKDRRHKEQEVVPLLTSSSRSSMSEFLLSDEESTRNDSGLNAPTYSLRKWLEAFQSCFRTDAHHYQNEKGERRAFCYCFARKKTCVLSFFFGVLLSILAFFIFGMVYFSPVSLPVDFVDQPLTNTPRLLTLNIFMRPPGIKNNENDYKNDRLEYITHNILPLYDIITIQEAFAFANRRIDHLLTAAFQQGFHYHVSSTRHYPWELAGDGGLLILSRFPIRKADTIEFPRGVHSDWLSYKGALHALIQINSTMIHVYTTHTQASYDNGGKLNFDDTRVRLSQFALVHDFMLRTAKDDSYPILLMGDLNVDAAVHYQTHTDAPSVNSSLPYTMMMDVLTGKGTDLNLIANVSSNQKQIEYISNQPFINLTDVVYDTFGHHPVTFGDYHRLDNGTLIPAETVLTSHNQLMTVQSIDRMLWSGNRGHNSTNIRPCNVTVEPFFIDKSASLPFTQISDHYGLSALLCED